MEYVAASSKLLEAPSNRYLEDCDLLLWACIEGAVAERPEDDGRIVMRLGAIVQVHFQQADMVPDRRRNCGGE